MWNTLASLKDTISQIASDVQDTAEELEIGGSQHDSDGSGDVPGHHRNSFYRDPNLKAELEWYRSEVNRLQAAESDIQSMSINYVTLLKEREEEVHRLKEENDQLRKLGTEQQQHTQKLHLEELQIQCDALNDEHKQELERILSGGVESPLSKTAQSTGNGMIVGHELQLQDLNLKVQNLMENEKELSSQLAEKDQSFAKLKTLHDRALTEVKKLQELLKKEREGVSLRNLQLQRDWEAREAATKDCDLLKLQNVKVSAELQGVKEQLDAQVAQNAVDAEKLKLVISKLEIDNVELQIKGEKLSHSLQAQQEELEKVKLELASTLEEKTVSRDLQSEVSEVDKLERCLREAKESCASHTLEFERQLEKVSLERDKAARDLGRLKQHLLDKEMADSEKMDQDSEQIADLEAKANSNHVHALQLEQALSQALADHAEADRHSKKEFQRALEETSSLQHKLASCMAALESKDIELSNLQSALGQYYAESEAQDRLYRELSAAKEEISKLLQELQFLNKQLELKNMEKDATVEKLASMEHKSVESQQRIQKLEEEVLRLRRALEQSMTRLNSLSSDSDHHVDRRIVIKLLVTYFQRNHSREVLDLMVRMLGFSEEDKRRVGIAQQAAGRGVVRGVLGLPGRFVGGLIGSASSDSLSSLPMPAENQSFADLWIDFLLKESEERERREKAEAYKQAELKRAELNPSAMDAKPATELPGFYSGLSTKGSISHPTSPSRIISHRPSTSFTGFSLPFSSPYNPPNRSETTSQLPGSANGIASGSDKSFATGTEFLSISLNSSSAAPSCHPKLLPKS